MNEEEFESKEEDAKQIPQPAELQESPGKKKKGRSSFAAGLIIGILLSWLCILILLKIQGRQMPYLMNGSSTDKNTVLTKEVQNKIRLLEGSIDQNFIGEVSDEDMATGIYKGMVDATNDRYSEYYTKEELEKVQESATGVFYGIGAYVGIDTDTDYPKLTGIMEDTPAEKAGLKAEDIIVEVDGEDVRGKELNDVVSKIKGERGTDVVLTIYRQGETDYLHITVTRDKVESPTVTLEMLEGDIAYIIIRQFETVTVGQFKEKLEEAKEKKVKGILLDLRGKPGGTLDSVVQIARELLPEGLIVYTEDKYGNRNEFKCDGSKKITIPLVVLVNENSASAAEILSGAIKDYKIGTLVGKTTYGKGIVQKVFAINDGTAVKLTISHYYTPNGNDIHEVGVEPDIEVDLDVEKYVDDGTDTQYDKALSVLKDKIKKGEAEK